MIKNWCHKCEKVVEEDDVNEHVTTDPYCTGDSPDWIEWTCKTCGGEDIEEVNVCEVCVAAIADEGCDECRDCWEKENT